MIEYCDVARARGETKLCRAFWALVTLGLIATVAVLVGLEMSR